LKKQVIFCSRRDAYYATRRFPLVHVRFCVEDALKSMPQNAQNVHSRSYFQTMFRGVITALLQDDTTIVPMPFSQIKDT